MSDNAAEQSAPRLEGAQSASESAILGAIVGVVVVLALLALGFG